MSLGKEVWVFLETFFHFSLCTSLPVRKPEEEPMQKHPNFNMDRGLNGEGPIG
jgi:hypothetical protein